MANQNKKDTASKLFLFPRRYKFIGGLLTAIGLVGLYFKNSGLGLSFAGDANRYDPLKLTLFIVLILGLFTMAWTREKTEDEMAIQIRLIALGISFLLGILAVIAIPVIILVTGGQIFHLNATYLVIGMLICYMICSNILKGYFYAD